MRALLSTALVLSTVTVDATVTATRLPIDKPDGGKYIH
jgi:hypothetical protein